MPKQTTYFCEYCNREIEVKATKNQQVNCKICKKVMKVKKQKKTQPQAPIEQPDKPEQRIGYIATESKKQGYITPIHKREPRPERLTEIPKDAKGRPDILKMQDMRESGTGIPKQTSEERRLQKMLNDAFK